MQRAATRAWGVDGGGTNAAEVLAAVAVATELGSPIFALDTSTDVATLALATPDTPARAGRLFVRQSPARALPSEAVMPALVDVLAQAQLAPTELAALVIGLGPGSFTGLRVGLSTLKGLGYAAAVPLFGGSSLAMLAACAGPGRVGVLRDARRGSAYFGAYDVAADGSVQTLAADACLHLTELDARIEAVAAEGATLLVGDEALAAPGRSLVPLPEARAAWLIVHARARLLRQEADELATLAPAYLQAFTPPNGR